MLAGSLIAPAKKLIDLEKNLAEEENALKSISQKKANIEIIQLRIVQNTEQTAKIEKGDIACGEKIESLFCELENLVEETTGKPVKISRKL